MKTSERRDVNLDTSTTAISSHLLCEYTNLHNEADVEALFVERLFRILKYPDNRIRRKETLDKLHVSRGAKKEPYRPDYVVFDARNRPRVIFDAKSPSENPEKYRYQVAGYALGLNSKCSAENPVRFVVVTNGKLTMIWEWDNDAPLLKLNFTEFEKDNAKFIKLRSVLSYDALKIEEAIPGEKEFRRPPMDELLTAFDTAHQIIWKKDKLGPTDAFYEFTKLIFVKLREDQRISKLVDNGRSTLNASDFNFTTQWIHQQLENDTSQNPVADVLFKRIRKDLEHSINEGKKKRIFGTNEKLMLKPSTIEEVVKLFENYDLHGIDEDLNGRMFETFLNATVRGKELGQFFTPRSVVKYMTSCANLEVGRNCLPKILDACCGSGGFLIEAMAQLSHRISALNQLTESERQHLIDVLHSKCLYGIEANDKVTRIARLNMYLHGDGGSRIYTADGLDKKLEIEQGVDDESNRWTKELKNDLLGVDPVRFDVVLTNPPFSMSYKRSNEKERKILNEYRQDLAKSSSIRSNVLFLERYLDLLSDEGEIITVIDNTVLNGTKSQNVRDFILEHFVIRQVVSLPFNTFFRAQANVQTSILHVRRKYPGEEQGDVFMGILNNIGHDDHQRPTPERDNTNYLIEAWKKWNELGNLDEEIKPNDSDDENLGCSYQVFITKSEDLQSTRLDSFYYAPELRNVRNVLDNLQNRNKLKLVPGKKFQLVKPMTTSDVHSAKGGVFRYFEIGDTTLDGQIVNFKEDYFENLPTRARLQVQEGDVVFAKNNSSRGKTVIVPSEFNGHLASTGFLAVRPTNFEEALLLWSIMTSETFRTQVYYLAITAVQPEIRESIFKDEFVIPIPTDYTELVSVANGVKVAQNNVRSAVDNARMLATKLFCEPNEY